MTRTPLIAGNWKMHLNRAEAAELAKAVADASKGLTDREVMVAPAYLSLAAVKEAVSESPVKVAAQNVAWEKQGAFTGEISPPMLQDVGVDMVILGHSERRHVFGEDNTMVNQRLLGALQFGLSPILCVGETLDERELGNTFKVVEEQLSQGLKDVQAEQMQAVVIAYEPVWAIGTGKTATKEQAQEVHAFIRTALEDLYEKTLADSIRILYGGSVKPENIDSLMAQPDVDGALVGGAALQAESFARIINFT
ncbi:MAG: triose-phosphate isomerase [Candidatus Electrothrix aestuarii]|uniref:Triosephosphate isomerase n=1 Tax=Candidatus Electrothrix aestuarii TaxID=3062594 RepID=A0AAU8M1R9_9BACT|nr:triose-phosphate isomerase [Candidatus Electrothrix aestuarii]